MSGWRWRVRGVTVEGEWNVTMEGEVRVEGEWSEGGGVSGVKVEGE